MTIDRAKEMVQTGFIWANWSSEQKDAFRTLLLEVEKVKQLEKENKEITNRLFELQQERDNPQPLTLEQLHERVGKPIYITVPGRADLNAWHFIVNDSDLGLVAKDSLGIYANGRLQGCYYDIEHGNNYGKTWLAYDHEPSTAN